MSELDVSSLKSLLASQTCGALLEGKTPTVTANLTDTIDTVLSKLQSNDIISVPIIDPTSGSISALVSVLDILKYISWGKYFRSESVSDEEVTKFRHLSHTVGSLIESKSTEKVWIYQPETKLISLLDAVSARVHRVVVVRKDDKGDGGIVPFVFSQTDIIRFLYSQKDNFKSIITQTVDQLQLGTQEIITIPSDTRALDGFKKMAMESVSAVAITDKENGKIIGNLSASDLRSLNSQKLPHILHYVGKFLVLQHGCVRKPVIITGSTTLHEIFHLFLQEKVHRVWKVDSDRRPIGVVSMTDIIEALNKLPDNV